LRTIFAAVKPFLDQIAEMKHYQAASSRSSCTPPTKQGCPPTTGSGNACSTTYDGDRRSAETSPSPADTSSDQPVWDWGPSGTVLGDDTYISGASVGSSIWLRQRKPGETGLYLGIVCDSNEAVDAAYAAAIRAGGIDDGQPADRTYFAPGYYAANVADFDGNRLEFVHKAWNPER
jgi:hypothetical protein